MLESPKIQAKKKAIHYCVLIPTYNNANTLSDVLDRVLSQTEEVLVVNDGSTDQTANILEEYHSRTIQIHLSKNIGKGHALRIGLKRAYELGFDFAITLDSDGQHFPEDIPRFIEEAAAFPTTELLLIGARNLNAKGMPRKNSFANKFSNFWYWAETGESLEDTQSGFRMYPLKAINKLSLFSAKFEFEVEVIVKATWHGVTVKNIPIQVFYHPTERVSHYRPFKDFVRISLMNTYLFSMAVFYIKPRDFYRRFKDKGWKRFLREDVLRSHDSPLKKSLSIAVGTFVGASPFWGFHTILAIGVAAVFKLNKVISYAFSNISFPIFVPFLVYGSLQIGGAVLGSETRFSFSQITSDFDFMLYFKQYVIGSFILALMLGLLFGLISYVSLLLYSNFKAQGNHG
ncbi:DUF2062 domain-containing protein [Flavobacteriaceae bacterium F08102]|nr:DUF2062 domain-containing protein [Flavobacteriaceae bacterium F08102]